MLEFVEIFIKIGSEMNVLKKKKEKTSQFQSFFCEMKKNLRS